MSDNGKKRRVVILPERCGLSESKRRDFVVDVEIGTSPEELLEPESWSHLAWQFNQGDTIEARPDDFKWVAKYRVVYAERAYAKVILESLLQIGENVEVHQGSVNHKVEWKGPRLRFAVIRLSDSVLVRAEFQTREEATRWMVEHEKAL